MDDGTRDSVLTY